MFDTKEEILDQIRVGEDGRAEFKEMRFGNRGVLSPNTEDLAGELVAFANAEGGAVFLGVDDYGGVHGIPPESLDVAEHWLLNIATHNCNPPIRPVVRKVLLPSDSGVMTGSCWRWFPEDCTCTEPRVGVTTRGRVHQA